MLRSQAAPIFVVLLLGALIIRLALLPLTAGNDFRAFDILAALSLHGHDVYALRAAHRLGTLPWTYFPLLLHMFAALQPTRLLFSHFGPVPAVTEALERAADEIRLWVDETRRARDAGLGLDHAAAMVAERTRGRYAALQADADPALAAKYERISSTAANVAGIMRWLDASSSAKPGPGASPDPPP